MMEVQRQLNTTTTSASSTSTRTDEDQINLLDMHLLATNEQPSETAGAGLTTDEHLPKTQNTDQSNAVDKPIEPGLIRG